MAQAKTVLVATVVHPERRFRISQKQFDRGNKKAEEAGRDSPFIVQEEDCEGGKSFDQLSKKGRDKVIKTQAKRQKVLDAKEAAEEEE